MVLWKIKMICLILYNLCWSLKSVIFYWMWRKVGVVVVVIWIFLRLLIGWRLMKKKNYSKSLVIVCLLISIICIMWYWKVCGIIIVLNLKWLGLRRCCLMLNIFIKEGCIIKVRSGWGKLKFWLGIWMISWYFLKLVGSSWIMFGWWSRVIMVYRLKICW